MRYFLTALVLAVLLIGCGSEPGKSSDPVQTIADATAHAFDTNVVAERPTTRVGEYAERITPGIHRWSVTFMSDEYLTVLKVNSVGETEILNHFSEKPGFYSDSFYGGLPSPRDLEDGSQYLKKARRLVKAKFPNHKIETGHILRYNYCLPPSDGKKSDYANGCERNQPLHKWRIYLKTVPDSGDWTVKEVTFGDDALPVIANGPRGFFE